MSLSEIRYLLKDAHESLTFIKSSYQESLDTDEVSIALQLKIKHFLEDIKSSLDYMGYHIFTKLCADNITAKFENHVRNLYFPSKDKEKRFTDYINSMYPGLTETNPEIVKIFYSVQPFNNIQWFINLNNLVNRNKHRQLEKQRISTSAHVQQLNINAIGFNMINSKFEDIESSIVKYEDTEIDLRRYENNPHVDHLDASYTVDFKFKESNLSVIPTLEEIYSGANSVIIELEKIL